MNCKYIEYSLLSLVKFPAVILGFILAGQISSARPGEILPIDFPEFSKQGTVYAVAEAPDGGVFVAGDFKEVDGVPRPGLAKLGPDGRLDEAFAPTIAPMIWQSISLLPPDPIESFGLDILQEHEKKLIPLTDGGLIVLGEERWELRDADGSLNTVSLPSVEREGESVDWPLLDSDGSLFILIRTENGTEIQAFAGESLERDLSFELLPKFTEIHETDDGTLWGLSRGIGAGGFPTLTRLSHDGGIESDSRRSDLSFSSRVNSTNSNVLEITNGRAPRPIDSNYLINYTGVKFHVSYRVWDPWLEEEERYGFDVPFGRYEGLAAGSMELGIIYPTYGLQFLKKAKDWVIDESFQIPLAGPEVPPVGPTETRHVMVTSDGQILVGGNRKYLGDGSPDSSWHVARISRDATIYGLEKRKNGEVLVWGDFDRVDGEAIAGLAALTEEGDLNSNFRPSLDLRFIKQLEERPDGRIVILSSRGKDDLTQSSPNLIEVDSDGAFLETIPLTLDRQYSDDKILSVEGFGLQSDGGILYTMRIPKAYENGGVYTTIYMHLSWMEKGEFFGIPSPVFGDNAIPTRLSDNRFIAGKNLIGPQGQSTRNRIISGALNF